MLYQSILSLYHSNIYIDCCVPSEDVFTSVLRAVGVYSTILSRCGLQTFKASLGEDNENQKWCCLITQPAAKVIYKL